jgi:hypothetical protein
VLDASRPDASSDAGPDARTDAREAATCGEAELLRTLPAYVEALNFGPACLAKIDISSLMPFLYDLEDVGCSNTPFSCLLQASMTNIKFTLKFASADAGPRLMVTGLNVEATALTSSGCGAATQAFNGMLP